ncbi:MAG: hypothetical protein MJY60_07030 [Bacteroidales bacterium]|nr:hypothetical protein [Bacteroidales bacterium]
MRKILCLIVVAASLASCAGSGRKAAEQAPANEQICGGYTSPDQPSDEELAMFNSLMGNESTELVPISVARQVVNGTNYKFLCAYRDSVGNQGNCYVIIYKPLNGDPVVKGLEPSDN